MFFNYRNYIAIVLTAILIVVLLILIILPIPEQENQIEIKGNQKDSLIKSELNRELFPEQDKSGNKIEQSKGKNSENELIAKLEKKQEAEYNSMRKTMVAEISNLSALAAQYYNKPISVGGGGNTYNGWMIPPGLQVTIVAKYQCIIESDQKLIITGVGKHPGIDKINEMKIEVINTADKCGKIKTTN